MGLCLKVKTDKWNMLNKLLNRSTIPVTAGYPCNQNVKKRGTFYELASGNNLTSEMLQEHLSIMGFVPFHLVVSCREHSAPSI